MNEIWKDVVGYEGFYQVTVLGQIRRNPLNYSSTNESYKNGYCLSQRDNGMGYLRVKLSKHGKYKSCLVHRIIAEVFIENPNNYKTVHHIDNNKKNNNINNLMWCTQSYNCKVEYTSGRRTGIERVGSDVICIVSGTVYPSIAKAARTIGINKTTLHDMLTGKTKTNRTTLRLRF